MLDHSSHALQAQTEFVVNPLGAYRRPRSIKKVTHIPLFIKLQIIDTPDIAVTLSTCKLIMLGREPEIESPKFHRFDLSQFGASVLGVSRSHAAIYLKNGQIVVLDAGSQNGTFLNEKELYPKREYPLKNGDCLKLGKLALQVSFEF